MKSTALFCKFCWTGLLVFVALGLNAQQNGLSFGLGVPFEIEKHTNSTGSTLIYTNDEYQLSYNPSFAYLRFTRLGDFHLFEFTRMGFKYEDGTTMQVGSTDTLVINGELTFDLFLAARYSYHFPLSSGKLIQSYVGLGFQPYFERNVVEPKVAHFKHASTHFTTDIELMGTVLFTLSENVKMNVSVPVKIWYRTQQWYRVDNPAIPISQQTTTEVGTGFFPPRFELKAGIIYQFKKKEAQSQ